MYAQEIESGVLSNYPTTEEQLRTIAGEVCILPKELNSDCKYLVDNNWVFVEKGEILIHNPIVEKLELNHPVKINGRWVQTYTIVSLDEVDILTNIHLELEKVREVLYKKMQEKANELLDGIESPHTYITISSYLTSNNPTFMSEAESFIRWRNLVWDYFIIIRNNAYNNKFYNSTQEEVIANMPLYDELLEE